MHPDNFRAIIVQEATRGKGDASSVSDDEMNKAWIRLAEARSVLTLGESAAEGKLLYQPTV